MGHLVIPVNLSEQGGPDLFDYPLTKLEGSYSNKGHGTIYRTEEAYETYLPKNDVLNSFFSSAALLIFILI